MPRVSVIIAVYKAEPFIERCARSLFEQTLDDIEYIFVDDCSPDRSIEVMQLVLEDYPERKPLVRVIPHEVNQGVSITRQDGVDAATGDYIIHCDPDDWLDLDAYEVVYNEALRTGADFVMFDDYRASNAPQGRPEGYEDSLSLLEDFSGVSGKVVFPGLCRNMIKAGIAKKALIPSKVCNGEDANVMFQILRDSLKIVYLPKRLYHYYCNPNSLTKRNGKEDLQSDMVNIELLEAMKVDSNERYNHCVDSFIFAIIGVRAFNSGIYTNKEFKSIYGRFRHTARWNRRCSRITRVLIYWSMSGFYRQSLFLYKTLQNLRNAIFGL